MCRRSRILLRTYQGCCAIRRSAFAQPRSCVGSTYTGQAGAAVAHGAQARSRARSVGPPSKSTGMSACPSTSFRNSAGRHAGQPRHRPHQDGDGVRRHDQRSPPVRPGRSMPGPRRLAAPIITRSAQPRAQKASTFTTQNDSEVAAGYLTWRMKQVDSLERSCRRASRISIGFFTFVVGTETGFAVLREPIACRPAIMAEVR